MNGSSPGPCTGRPGEPSTKWTRLDHGTAGSEPRSRRDPVGNFTDGTDANGETKPGTVAPASIRVIRAIRGETRATPGALRRAERSASAAARSAVRCMLLLGGWFEQPVSVPLLLFNVVGDELFRVVVEFCGDLLADSSHRPDPFILGHHHLPVALMMSQGTGRTHLACHLRA